MLVMTNNNNTQYTIDNDAHSFCLMPNVWSNACHSENNDTSKAFNNNIKCVPFLIVQKFYELTKWNFRVIALFKTDKWRIRHFNKYPDPRWSEKSHIHLLKWLGKASQHTYAASHFELKCSNLSCNRNWTWQRRQQCMKMKLTERQRTTQIII